MDERGNEDRDVAAGAPASGADANAARRKDHFLQLMFFRSSHGADAPYGLPGSAKTTGDYAPLRHSKSIDGARYTLPRSSSVAPVQLDSAAIEVMTDLRRVGAVTIDLHASLEAANQAMIVHRVRALFVVDDARQIFGIVTATDTLGERPVQFAQARGIHYDEIVVRDIMTPADRLEVLDLQDVQRARVGDLVATLKLAGRQHALAVEAADAAHGQQCVRGIFSLTQIARQLGIAPQQMHDIARTFAEIEAVIAS